MAGCSVQDIESKIKAREEQPKPLCTQLACEFADLHDRTPAAWRRAGVWRRRSTATPQLWFRGPRIYNKSSP